MMWKQMAVAAAVLATLGGCSSDDGNSAPTKGAAEYSSDACGDFRTLTADGGDGILSDGEMRSLAKKINTAAERSDNEPLREDARKLLAYMTQGDSGRSITVMRRLAKTCAEVA